MKKKLLILASVVALSLSFQGGCVFSGANQGPALSAATSSSIVVNAEKALREAKDTIDTFLHLEYNHKDFIKKNLPVVHAGAERLRRDAPDALLAANRVKNAFKHNRSAENQASLMTAVTTVVQLAGEAKAYTETLNSSTP